MQLDRKTVAITGAAGDIGMATARALQSESARLAMIDISSEALEEAKQALGSTCLPLVADVTREDDLARAAQEASAALGPIDILFVNAGIEQPHIPLPDLDKSIFDRVLAVNLTGAFLTVKHFLPVMSDGGSIILTSSIAGLMGIPAYSAYSASKGGLIALMRSLAVEAAPRRIRCNSIHPGTVRSRMIERTAQEATHGGDPAEWYAAVTSMAKLGRLVEPHEVAELVLFLASDRSQMITGQSIAVDGGMLV